MPTNTAIAPTIILNIPAVVGFHVFAISVSFLLRGTNYAMCVCPGRLCQPRCDIAITTSQHFFSNFNAISFTEEQISCGANKQFALIINAQHLVLPSGSRFTKAGALY
jgi:hypothetical protein